MLTTAEPQLSTQNKSKPFFTKEASGKKTATTTLMTEYSPNPRVS